MVHARTEVDAIPFSSKNHIGDLRKTLRGAIVHVHTPVVDIGKEISMGGGDDQIIKSVMVQIRKEEGAFLLIGFTFSNVLWRRVHSACVLPGK